MKLQVVRLMSCDGSLVFLSLKVFHVFKFVDAKPIVCVDVGDFSN